MSKSKASVLADALRLDDGARAELAAELLASLDGPAGPDAEAAWDAEIERRIKAIEPERWRLSLGTKSNDASRKTSLGGEAAPLQ